MTEFIEILPGCPYHGFSTSLDLTCEEGLCWWVRQPINVISSLAHLIVAFYAYRIGKAIKSQAHKDIGIIASLIAVASMGAHATHLKFFGTFDFTLQYLLMAHLIWVNASRLGRRPPFNHWPFSLFLFFFLTLVQSLYPQISTPLYAIMLIGLLYMEWLCFRRWSTRDNWSYEPLLKCAGLFFAGLICFFLDSQRIVCDPNNHWFQLHAVWHLLTAWSLLYLANFYMQHNGHFESARVEA
ncbi:MAG: hypothetical protein HRT45_10085 [Bdellovibrionales bacterium]|nr:hypothetical protein [Bdellovibrionales bacterium]